METVLLCALFGFFIIVSYTLGLKNGQKLKKDENIELPKVTETVKEVFHKEKGFEDKIMQSFITPIILNRKNLEQLQNKQATY